MINKFNIMIVSLFMFISLLTIESFAQYDYCRQDANPCYNLEPGDYTISG